MKMQLIVMGMLCLVLAACDSEVSSEARSAPRAPEKPTWNVADANAATNGNMLVALDALNSGKSIPEAGPTKAALVAKAPWNYYGKRLCFSGTAGIVQDYPPGSEVSNVMRGPASEVVVLMEDGTIVDTMVKGSSGDLAPDDAVTVCGLAVGNIEVDNQLGGKTTQLLLVGTVQ